MSPKKEAKSAAPQKAKADKPDLHLSEDMFKQLFGEGVEVDDVLQISFDDVDLEDKKDGPVSTFKPKEFLKTGDKISNDIVEGFQKGEAVYKEKEKTERGLEPIVTRVSFVYKNVGLDKGFTSLDKEVHDAVVSLYAAGNKVFSPAMVYRTMAGRSDATFVPQEKLKEITASIYKCMSSIITIDASEEASLYGMEALYSQNLIYAKAVTLKTRGWKVHAFMLIDEPVLYKYAKLKEQIFSVPLRVLDSPPNKTNDIIVLQGHLMRVVESLRQGSKMKKEVLYATLYELLDCADAPKQKLQRIRNNVAAILDYWKEIGYIRGYGETVQGRAKHSVVLDVPKGKLSTRLLLEEKRGRTTG